MGLERDHTQVLEADDFLGGKWAAESDSTNKTMKKRRYNRFKALIGF